MQKSRRNFAKNAAMVVAGGTVLGSTAVLANSSESDTVNSLSNGVVVGKSNKKEITYKKTEAWSEYYKNAI